MIGTRIFNITRKSITIDGSKVYDSNTSVSAANISTFNGLVSSETLNINGTGSISSSEVASNKTLTLGSLSLANGSNGGIGSNYSITSGTFDVTARAITLS